MAIPAREYHTQQVHYLRLSKTLAQLTSGTAVTIGTLPAGAIVQDAYALVTTAFNSATSDLLDMGTSADPNGFMTAVSIASVGKKVADELATSDDLYSASEVTVSATWTGSGTAPTTGALTFVVEYIPNNDR